MAAPDADELSLDDVQSILARPVAAGAEPDEISLDDLTKQLAPQAAARTAPVEPEPTPEELAAASQPARMVRVPQRVARQQPAAPAAQAPIVSVEPAPSPEEIAASQQPARMTMTRAGKVQAAPPMPAPETTPQGEEMGQFSRGVMTGVKGAQQMAMAAGTIPAMGAARSIGEALQAFDKIDRGEPIAVRGLDFVSGQAGTYQEATPDQRARMRGALERRLASNQEFRSGLVDAWQRYGEEMKQYEGRTPNFTDIKDVSGFGDWFAFNFGQGLPYMGASVLSALLGAAVGGPAGAAVGIAGSGYAMGVGDIQSGLMEKGIHDRPELALAGAAPYAALDFLGPVGRAFRALSGATLRQAAGTYLRRLGREVTQNAIEEFINEAGQEIVKDFAVTTATGEKLVTPESLQNWFNAGMAGMAAGGPAGVASAGLPGAPQPVAGGQLPPEQPAPAQQPPAAPPAPPVAEPEIPVAAFDRADLEAVLNDPRPFEEQQAERAAEEAAAAQQAEQAIAATQEQLAQQYGLPPAGRAVVQMPGGQPMAGEILSIEEDADAGGWAVRFRGDDGQLYEIQGTDNAVIRGEPDGAGTRDAPVKVQDGRDVDIAAANVDTAPTEAQKEAGNYQKGHIAWNGLDISIENPAGSERRGVGPDGNEWSVSMPAHYGYIKRTEGADGDHLDVYIGQDAQSQTVYVVDQIDPATGKFDEHKAMLGFGSADDALDTYQRGFSDGTGMQRMGAVTQMSLDEFKVWAREGDTKTPLTYVKPEEPTVDEISVEDVEEALASDATAVLTKAGEAPNDNGVYDKDGEGVEHLTFKEKKGSAEIDVVELADGRWISAPSYQHDQGDMRGMGTPLTEQQSYSTRDEAVAAAAQEIKQRNEGIVASVDGSTTDAQKQVAARIVEWANDLLGIKPTPTGGAEPNGFEPAIRRPAAPIENPNMDRTIVDGKITTISGRKIKVPPRIRVESNRKTQIDLKNLDKWLIEQAIEEAKSRGDDFNVTQFSAIKLGNVSPSDRDSMSLYLFGEENPVFSAEEKKSEDQPSNKPEVDEVTIDQIEESAREPEQPVVETPPVADDQPAATDDGAGETRAEPDADAGDAAPADTAAEESGPAADEAPQSEEEKPATPPVSEGEKSADQPAALKGDRLEDVGEKMAGKRADEIKKELEDGATGNVAKDIQKILDRASKASVWKIAPPEGATPGTAVYLTRVRDSIKSLLEHAGAMAGGGRGKWSSSFSEALENWVGEDTDNRRELEKIASDYIAMLERMRDATKDAMTIEQARAALEKMIVEKTLTEDNKETGYDASEWTTSKGDKNYAVGERIYVYYSDFGKGLRKFIVKKSSLASIYSAKHGIAGDIKEDTVLEKNKPLTRPRLENIQRVDMPDRRNGRDVTGQDFIDTFGFRGVEFGNLVNSAERQINVNHAYDALWDLAETIGAPPKAISLGGKLGLAFGSRGRGNAAAHYEPGNVVINLTKTQGDGTVAHEWGHALDYALQRMGHKKIADDLKTALAKTYDVKRALDTVDNLLSGRTYVQGQKSAGPLEMARRYIDGEYWTHTSWGVVKPTEYKREADKIGKDYWGNPEELWAREFESFVYDELAGESPYLVTSWVADGTVTNDSGHKGRPYPHADERAQFHGYFRHLLENIEWTDEGPKVKDGYETVTGAQIKGLREALDKAKTTLEERLRQLKTGEAKKDGLFWYQFADPNGSRGPGKQPKGYFAFDDSLRGIGYPQALDPSDLTEFVLRLFDTNWQPGGGAVYLNKEEGNGRDRGADEIRPDGEDALDGASAADGGASEADGGATGSTSERAGAGQKDGGGDGERTGGGPGERTGGGDGDVRPPSGGERTTDLASGQDAVQPAGANYRITDADHVGEGSIERKFADNIAAIKVLKKVEAEGRLATAAEQKILVKYVGWGGMPQAFGYHYQEGWEARKKELQELLTQQELGAARASTTNAHYTAPQVIRTMWEAVQRFGFTGGRILEPAIGVGHFYGMMPKEIADASKLTGVELDSLSARIAKQLYQRAAISNKGYETATYPERFFDLVISNVPFSEADKPVDKKYNKERLNLHDYYFRKSIELTRPGGIVVFITSKGTLDKTATKARELFAEKAELIGAIRLPEDAFMENANTTVTTDIIFLRRKVEGADPLPGRDWIGTKEITLGAKGEFQQEYDLNQYFVDFPEMMIGEMYLRSGRYGNETEGALRSTGGDLGKKIAEAVKTMPENIVVTADRVEELELAAQSIPADDFVKDGAFAEKDGKLWIRQGEIMEPVSESTPKEKKRGQIVRDSIKLRDKVRTMLRLRVSDAPEAVVKDAKAEIDVAYKAFVKKHGNLNDKENVEAFAEDPDAALLLAIEKWDPETGKAERVEIDFQKRKPVEHTDSAQDALVISLNERGRVDFPTMTRLTGMSPDHLKSDLQGLIYDDPEQGWVTAEEYLSGNVREKLRIARTAAEADSAFEGNVKALEAVQPEDLPPSKISARPGAPWIPGSDVGVFMAELLDVSASRLSVEYLESIGKWVISSSGRSESDEKRVLKSIRTGTEARVTWGTRYVDFVDLMDYALNGGFPVVYYPPDADGKRAVNRKATEEANAKLLNVKERFSKWIWEDPDRAARLSRKYNDEYNAVRLREFKYPAAPDQIDAQNNIRLPGMAVGMALRQHQAAAVWRNVQSGNTYFAHEVGTGKTFTMTAAAMELKRLGIAKKPMIAVLNSTIGQFKAEFLRLYPGANILALNISESKQQRKRQLARIALNDWDAVIVTHESFSRIPMSRETIEMNFGRELEQLTDAILAAKADKMTARVVKELEKSKKALENKMKRELEKREKDDVLSFEELGVDEIFVDEAQEFKNLMFATRMGRQMRGLNPEGSGRAFDLFMKSNWLNDNIGRGINLASGTSISNSVGELFTISRYLQPSELRKRGIAMFDPWANTFGDIGQVAEYLPEGGGYQMVTKFNRFVNIPELMQMVYGVMDTVTADKAGIKRPKIKGGKQEAVLVPQNEGVADYMEALKERALGIRNNPKGALPDNMLAVVTDGRKAAMDMRLVDPALPDYEQTKTNEAVSRILTIYEREKGKKGVQLVFSDLGVPGEDRFSVYEDLKAKLVKRGIPAGEIAFVHDAKNDRERKVQFSKVRAGSIRVWVASTKKGGTGVNVQDRVAAIHNLDTHWNLANLLQRLGRGQRQGNIYDEIEVYNYATEGTVDAFMWDKVQAKGRFVDQIMSGDVSLREAEDISQDTMSAAEMVAVASGDPLIAEKVELESSVQKLSLQAAAFDDTLVSVRRELVRIPERIKALTADVNVYEAEDARLGKIAEVTIGDKTFRLDDDKTIEELNKLIVDKAAENRARMKKEVAEAENLPKNKQRDAREKIKTKTVIGKLTGPDVNFPLSVRSGLADDFAFITGEAGDREWHAETTLRRGLSNVRRSLESDAKDARNEIKGMQEELPKLRIEAGRKFERQEEFDKKRARLAEVTRILTSKESNTTETEDGFMQKLRFRSENGGDVSVITKWEPVKLEGLDEFDFFAYQGYGGTGVWIVVETSTGLAVASSQASKDEAIESANRTVAQRGVDAVRERIESLPKLTDEQKENALAESQGDKYAVGWDMIEGDPRDKKEAARKVREAALAIVPDADLRIVDEIVAVIDGEKRTMSGAYRGAGNIITVSLSGIRDPQQTLRHEAIHSLKRMGLFTPAEWRALEDRADKSWRARFNTDARYSFLKGREDALREEAIADAYMVFAGGEQFGGLVQRAFAKIRNFLERLGNALRGMGFQTADDIFARVDSGEVGRRAGAAATVNELAFSDTPAGFKTGTDKRGMPIYHNDTIGLAQGQLQRNIGDGVRRIMFSIFDVKKRQPNGNPTKVGVATLDVAENGTFEALQMIEIARAYRQKGLGFGEATVRSLLEHNDGLSMKIMDIQHHTGNPEYDALPFWERIGTRLLNYSNDPNVEIDGIISLKSYRKARGDRTRGQEQDAARRAQSAATGAAPQAGAADAAGDQGDRGGRGRAGAAGASGAEAADERYSLSDTEQAAETAGGDIKPPDGMEDEPSVLGAGRRMAQDLGSFKKWAVHPRMIAAMDRSFTPVYESAVQQFERRDEIAAELGRLAEPYFDLPQESKERVNAVLELGRLQGKTFGRGKAPIVVKNEKEEQAQLSSPGETITLNDAEKGAYWGVRKSMNRALDLFREQMVEDWGLDPAKVKSADDVLALAANAEGAEKDRLETLAEILREVEQAKRLGYVPFTRWGQVGIVVKEPSGDPDAPAETVHYEMIELDGPVNRVRARFQTLGQIPDVKKRLDALTKQYPDAEIKVFQAGTKNAVEQVSMTALDALAEVAKVDESTWDVVRAQLEKAAKQKSFRKHFMGSANVPGYSTDFERALADYTVGMAGYLSRRRFASKWDNAIKFIPATKPKMRLYAEQYRAYVNEPQEELATLRSAAFLYYIAGSPATAMINMTQVPLITAPYLTQFANPVRVNRELAAAYKDVMLMLTVQDMKDVAAMRKSPDVFDPTKAPKDVRAALQHAWDQGFFVPLNVYEMMGLAYNRSAALRGARKVARVAAEDIALMFSAAERMNRLVTFVAAYRLGKMKTVEEAARASLKGNALARTEVLQGYTPEKFAEWVIDETHYRMGKVNRPKAMRGLGSAVLQFKSFIMQTVELYARLAAMQGPRGKVAFGVMMLLLLVTAGFWGLPFSEDLRDLIEAIYKRWKGLDLDIQTKAREIVYELTGSTRLARIFSKGIASESGVDVSQRIGQGNVLPDDLQNALGVPFDLTVQRAMQAEEYASRGQSVLAVAEMLPNFLRNPMTGLDWAEGGVRARKTGKVVIPAEEIKPSDKVLKALGFTPSDIAERREMEWARTRADNAPKSKRDAFYARLAALQAEQIRAEDAGNNGRAASAERRMEAIYKEIEAWNEGKPGHEQVNISQKTLRDRVRNEIMGSAAKKDPKQARDRVGRIREVYGAQ